MRRTIKGILGVGALAAATYAVWRRLEARRVDAGVTWEPQPFPYPPVPRERPPGATSAGAQLDAARAPDPPTVTGPGWVAPEGGSCPVTHPVKAKLASGIYHVPGGASYERTHPDRCYVSPAAAEADDLRAAKI